MQNRSPDDRHGWRIDLRLRLTGIGLLACSVIAVRALIALDTLQVHSPSGPMALGLAGISFITGCLGAGLLMLGHHVFDTVEVSQRWAPRRPSSPRQDVRRAAPDDVPQLSDVYAGSRIFELKHRRPVKLLQHLDDTE